MNAPRPFTDRSSPDADVICAMISQLGSHSQLKVLRHLAHEFSMFDCADELGAIADDIGNELLGESL